MRTHSGDDRLAAAVTEAEAGATMWAALSHAERAALLAEVRTTVAAQANRWVQTALQIKRLPPGSPLAGEEWMSGPYATLTGLTGLIHSLENLAVGRSPVDASRITTAPGGRVAVRVLPSNAYEGLLLHGFRGSVWMTPGRSEADVRASAGLVQREAGRNGGVGVVLGAGNITSIAVLDVFYELVAHNRASVLKLNPVMAPMMSVFLSALQPLVQNGLLRIVQGGAEVGGRLLGHPAVQHVHITGSRDSHDAIVWGTGPAGQAAREAGTPALTCPISSELGGVSPVVVIPGRWSRRDLRFQAEHIATQRLHNSGHNCIASQVVVVDAGWNQKAEFLRELRRALEQAPGRPTWYPGAAERVQRIAGQLPATRLGDQGERLLVGVTAGDDSPVLTTEYFAPVLGVVELPAGPDGFLATAVDYANDRLEGTLGANIVVAPRDRKALGARFDEAIARLRYGTIAVNAWTALGFLTAAATWGAFPGHTLRDVQSGIGIVHNSMLLDGPERTVIEGPFRPFPRSVLHGEMTLSPKPPWFVTARTAARTSELLTRFAAAPSWSRVPRIVLSAFRG